MIKAIFLDFDGVILESVSVKTDAFLSLFSFVPDHIDEIVQFHIDNGGISRFEKFRHIYANILHEELTQELFDRLSNRFSDLVEEKVACAPFVDGAREFIQEQSRNRALYIVSATPEEELRRIVDSRGLTQFFEGICGAPTKKADHIQRIIREKNLSYGEALFVGDAVNDWDAARVSGIRFIGRIKTGDPNRFLDLAGVEHIIRNFHDLDIYLMET
ncbi:MAG: HAD-IA family hydrolase [Methanoregula sp.]|nr:HAD-IA family hydrolase [Methanoregula sp.]